MRRAIERTKEDDQAFAEICGILAESSDASLVTAFLTQMLTPNEVTEIARRWRLLRLLHQGHSQRDVASALHLSLCKITRGSKELKRPGSALKKLLDARSES
jgi:TrpR family trp operon transcriptional repressor